MVPVTIKMTAVQKSMLVELSKRYRMKIDDLITELIEENYATKARKR